MALKLIIGNKTYSSWSMRPWLLMRHFEIAFDELVVPLRTPDTKATIDRFSPSGKLPVLIDGSTAIWESLAIIDYIAERWPTLPVWPIDPTARALARSLSAEMHAGFTSLRTAYPMNMRRAARSRRLDTMSAEAVARDVARLQAAWSDARSRFGAPEGGRTGEFLFGSFCAADAMFAPMISRLVSYAVDVNASTRAYMDAVLALPTWRDWAAGAAAEGWRIDAFEDL